MRCNQGALKQPLYSHSWPFSFEDNLQGSEIPAAIILSLSRLVPGRLRLASAGPQNNNYGCPTILKALHMGPSAADGCQAPPMDSSLSPADGGKAPPLNGGRVPQMAAKLLRSAVNDRWLQT
jgi:hypothetical protein